MQQYPPAPPVARTQGQVVSAPHVPGPVTGAPRDSAPEQVVPRPQVPVDAVPPARPGIPALVPEEWLQLLALESGRRSRPEPRAVGAAPEAVGVGSPVRTEGVRVGELQRPVPQNQERVSQYPTKTLPFPLGLSFRQSVPDPVLPSTVHPLFRFTGGRWEVRVEGGSRLQSVAAGPRVAWRLVR